MAKTAKRRVKNVAQKPQTKKTYYSSLFATGVIFFLFGAMDNSTLFYVLGIVLAIVGIANKDKWKDEECNFDKKTILITAAVAIMIAFVLSLLLRN